MLQKIAAIFISGFLEKIARVALPDLLLHFHSIPIPLKTEEKQGARF
jgi:hypothetical protein